MAATTELENLLIRLQGDASGYLASLKQAEGATRQTATKLEKETATVAKAGAPSAATMQAVTSSTAAQVKAVEEVAAKTTTATAAQKGLTTAVAGTTEQLKAASGAGGGLLQSVTGVAGKAAAIVGVAVAVSKLAQWIIVSKEEAQKLDDFLNSVSRAGRSDARLFGKQAQAGMEKIDKAGDRNAQLAQLDKEEKKIRENLKLQKEIVKTARDAVIKNTGKLDGIFGNKPLEANKQVLKDAEALLEQMNIHAENLQEKKFDLGINKKVNDELKQMNEQMRISVMLAEFQANNLNATQEELDLYRKRIEGADYKLIKLGQTLADQKKAADFAKQTNEMTRELEMQLNTFGQMPDVVKAYEMSLKGFTKQQIDSVRELNIMLQGKQLTEEFALPMEKFEKRLSDLNRMYEKGAISLDTYERAVDEARKSILGLRAALDPIQGAIEGSSEALTRLMAYRDTLSGRGKEVGFFGSPKRPDGRPGGPPERIPQDQQFPNEQERNKDSKTMIDLLRDLVEETKKRVKFPDIRIGGGF